MNVNKYISIYIYIYIYKERGRTHTNYVNEFIISKAVNTLNIYLCCTNKGYLSVIQTLLPRL